MTALVVIGSFAVLCVLCLHWVSQARIAEARALLLQRQCEELTEERDDARTHAAGWRDVAVHEGLGEGDGEDVLPWEEGYLEAPSRTSTDPTLYLKDSYDDE